MVLHVFITSFMLCSLLIWNFHVDSSGTTTKSIISSKGDRRSRSTFGISIANAFQLLPPTSHRRSNHVSTSFLQYTHNRSYGMSPLYQRQQTSSGGSSNSNSNSNSNSISGNDRKSATSRYSRTSTSWRNANEYYLSNPTKVTNNPSDTGKNDRTEVSRLKFVINQLKGNMQESEMRATAAENRVAMLQQQMKEMEGIKTNIIQEDKEESLKKEKSQSPMVEQVKVDKLKQQHEKETNSLKDQINNMKNSWDTFTNKSEKEMTDMKQQHADELKEWESKYNDLKLELDMAQKELSESKEEAINLRKEIQELELEMANRLTELKGQLVAEIKEVAHKKDNEISVIKVEAENMRNNMLREYEILEEKLIESQKGSRALMKDLERAKMDLTTELISFKERTQKELNIVQQRLIEKEMDLIATKEKLNEMKEERQSLRKLLRSQGSLIRDRLAKRFGRQKKQ